MYEKYKYLSVMKRMTAIFLSAIIIGGNFIYTSDFSNTSNIIEAQAAWSSVSSFQEYALKNWTKPIRANYLDISTGARFFGANRSGTDRKHAANDYVCAVGTPVYAMTGGYVQEYCANFYGGTQAISVRNDDGSVARYCEIKTSFKPGDRVEKGQQIGIVIANNIGGDHMLHLELYLGTASGSLSNTANNKYWYVDSRKYCRRQDLLDPTFLQKLSVDTIPIPPQSNDWYKDKSPVNLGDNFCATICNSTTGGYLNNDGWDVRAYAGTDKIEQYWVFSRQSDNSYIITSLYDTNRLTIYNNEDKNGSSVVVTGDDLNDCQKWFIYQDSNGYALRPSHSDRAMDLDGGKYEAGTNIQINEYRAHLKTPSKQEHKRHGTKKAIFIPKRSKYRLK